MFFSAHKPANTVQYATTPRYLVGGGDPRRVTEVLRAAGWTNHSDPLYPHVLLASPDLAIRLTLEAPSPDPYTAWWRFEAAGWYAHFGGHTPVEIVAGFGDALLQPEPEQPPTPADIRQILASTGWGMEDDGQCSASAYSPDDCIHVGTLLDVVNGAEHRTWHAQAALPDGLGGHERLWQAWFSHGTPTHLVAGFARELVDTAPVYRGLHEVPRSWLTTPVTVQGEQLAAEHRQRLDAARKHRKTPSARTALPPPTTAPTTPARR